MTSHHDHLIMKHRQGWFYTLNCWCRRELKCIDLLSSYPIESFQFAVPICWKSVCRPAPICPSLVIFYVFQYCIHSKIFYMYIDYYQTGQIRSVHAQTDFQQFGIFDMEWLMYSQNAHKMVLNFFRVISPHTNTYLRCTSIAGLQEHSVNPWVCHPSPSCCLTHGTTPDQLDSPLRDWT